MRVAFHKHLMFCLIVTVAVALGFQTGPKQIPPFEGDGNTQHDGQPKFCVNTGKEFLHNCDCQPKMGDPECHDPDKGGENPKCSVYCRRNACRCQRGCEKTE
jgi:hypothetical protein